MKPKLALIAAVSLAFVACDKKEEVTQSAKPEITKKKTFGSDQVSAHPKPVVPKPKPAAEPEIAQTPASEPEATLSPMPVPGQAQAQAQPKAPLSEAAKAAEELKAARLARMAKAQEERTAQMTAQLTTRFKEQDANGDGFLAKDEVSDRMQRRFTEADKDGNGFLDATEQQALIQASAQRMGDGGGQRRGGQDGGFAGQGRRNRNR